IDNFVAPRALAPLAGRKGIDTGVWNYNEVVGGGVAAHEFTHLMGVTNHDGAVLSNGDFINDKRLPRAATQTDFEWALRGTRPNFDAARSAASRARSKTVRDIQTVHAPWLGLWQ